MFRPGKVHGVEAMERCFEAKVLKMTVIPKVKQLLKDHKEPEADGILKTRSVCTACIHQNGRLSEDFADKNGCYL